MPLTGVNYHPKGHCSHLFSLETAYHHSFYFCLLQTVLGLNTESFIFNCWEIMFLRNITANVMQTRWPADKSHPCCLCRCRRPNFLSEFNKGSQWILFLLWVCYIDFHLLRAEWVMWCLINLTVTEGSQRSGSAPVLVKGSSLVKALGWAVPWPSPATPFPGCPGCAGSSEGQCGHSSFLCIGFSNYSLFSGCWQDHGSPCPWLSC